MRVWRRGRAATFSQNQAAGEREMSIFTCIEPDKQIESQRQGRLF
jgi:hypothetical protein